MPTPIHKRALQRAVEIAGGPEQLARELRIPATGVKMWLSPGCPVPADVFLQVVDFLVEHSLREMQVPPSDEVADCAGNKTI